ncbi:exopolysaccharide biosynthesis polyprenyl glycosylphosphotransferase [Tianweitania sp. BSSL-BM11]|uniref:Exopolysaccharide biosynthesis polyprenyl glycosylphosphotransferase n=1 Tax=Tianweitania aestuarii TaxID=2814886 RepID=A0ABS5RRG1_9HYPH|nr:exopolysaccharide biosynthesis polyprenyl glycosylphosphotransferase [Tianweitania aestuarii]MBS9719646.1 exopolysaccharide biosynthesis polyprenyl glycosylphosphotransferase [Tianweitania aestuarii]
MPSLDQSIPRLGAQRRLFGMTRFQLLGGLSFAILLPALLRMTNGGVSVLSESNMQTTLVAAFCAHVLGYITYRKLGTVPGIAGAGSIFPTFALAYGSIFLIIFFWRLDYSRFQAAGSFVMSTLWYFGMSIVNRRIAPRELAIVPGGAVDVLISITDIVWRRVSVPTVLPTGVSGIVVDLRADLSDEWERFIADAALAGIPVYHLKQVLESLTGRTDIEHLSENTLGSLNPNMLYLKIKQAMDWGCALIALILLSPLFLVIGLAIRLDSPGPAFFRQQRMGYRGKPFNMLKFRTMRAEQPSSRNRETAITRDNDVRITRLGRFLRRSRLDELPQAVNILRGEMSWIGPRPEAMALSELYEERLPFYRYRHIVRPGITGWAQVNQGHVSSVDEVLSKLHYDFYYIKNFSPWLDLVIVLRTIKTMLTGFGAK